MSITGSNVALVEPPLASVIRSSEPFPAPSPADPTLLDIFDATVARWGDRIALDTPEAVLSYREFAAAAQAVAGSPPRGRRRPG